MQDDKVSAVGSRRHRPDEHAMGPPDPPLLKRRGFPARPGTKIGEVVKNANKLLLKCIMADHIQNFISELWKVANETSDPVKRREVLRIIARLSDQDDWPDGEELIRLRLIYLNTKK